MGTTEVPDGGPYSTAEHLRAQNEQLDPKTHQPLPSLGAGEQAKPAETEQEQHTDEPAE